MRTDILKSINYICMNEMHDERDFNEIKDENAYITSSGIDSFDLVMLYIKLGDFYKVSDEDFKKNLEPGDNKLNDIINLIINNGKNIKSFDKIKELYDESK